MAWGLLFLGSLGLTEVAMRSDRRLLKGGAVLVSLGLAGTTVGFGFATAAGLVGLGDIALVGDTVAGLSMMFVFTLGSLVLGIALLRTEIVSRTIAGLMAAVGPGMILGVMIGVPVLDIVLFAGPVCAVWALIGYDLLSTDATIEEPAPIPA